MSLRLRSGHELCEQSTNKFVRIQLDYRGPFYKPRQFACYYQRNKKHLSEIHTRLTNVGLVSRISVAQWKNALWFLVVPKKTTDLHRVSDPEGHVRHSARCFLAFRMKRLA